MVLDQATLDRFAIVDFDYDMAIELEISKNNAELVSFVRELREKAKASGVRATFSYRCLSMTAKLEAAKMPLAEVIKIAIVKGLDIDTVRTLATASGNKYMKELRKLCGAA